MAHSNVARCAFRNFRHTTNLINSRAICRSSTPVGLLFRFQKLNVSALTVPGTSQLQNHVGYRWFADDASTNVDLSLNDLQALIKSNDIQLFDVREPKELVEYGRFPQAVNIPLSELKDALAMSEDAFAEHYKSPKPQPHHKNIVFCAQGPIKSKAALELAKKFSFKKARHYKGGWEEYHKAMGLPLKQNPTENS